MARRWTPLAGIWLRTARRAWQPLLISLLAGAGAAWVVGSAVLTLSSDGGPGRLGLLLASALVVVLLLPLYIPLYSILSQVRFDLLPYTATELRLFRAVLGSPIRTLGVLAVVGWGHVGLRNLELGLAASVLWSGCLIAAGLAGLVLGARLETAFRQSYTLGAGALSVGAILAASYAFTAVQRGDAPGRASPGDLRELLGETRPGGDLFLLALIAGLAAGGALLRYLAVRRAAARGAGPAESLPLRLRTGAVAAALASRLAATRPASLAKELSLTFRFALLWHNHLFFLVCSLVAVSSGTAPLVAVGFLFWIAFAFDLLGPDVPSGGLLRYRLLPLPIWRSIVRRHAAVLITTLIWLLTAMLVVAALGGWNRSAGEVLSLTLWYLYGASLFLLFTAAGDRLSMRHPHPMAMRAIIAPGAGTSSMGGIAAGFALFACTAAVAAVLLAGSMAAADRLPGSGAAEAGAGLAVALTTMMQVGIYAASVYRHTRAR